MVIAGSMSTAVVAALARARDGDVLDQRWLISKDIDTDSLDGPFQERNLRMTLQFEADTTTATIIVDRDVKPVIRTESHR